MDSFVKQGAYSKKEGEAKMEEFRSVNLTRSDKERKDFAELMEVAVNNGRMTREDADYYINEVWTEKNMAVSTATKEIKRYIK